MSPAQQLRDVLDDVNVRHLDAHTRYSRRGGRSRQEGPFAFKETGEPIELQYVHTIDIARAPDGVNSL